MNSHMCNEIEDTVPAWLSAFSHWQFENAYVLEESDSMSDSIPDLQSCNSSAETAESSRESSSMKPDSAQWMNPPREETMSSEFRPDMYDARRNDPQRMGSHNNSKDFTSVDRALMSKANAVKLIRWARDGWRGMPAGRFSKVIAELADKFGRLMSAGYPEDFSFEVATVILKAPLTGRQCRLLATSCWECLKHARIWNLVFSDHRKIDVVKYLLLGFNKHCPRDASQVSKQEFDWWTNSRERLASAFLAGEKWEKEDGEVQRVRLEECFYRDGQLNESMIRLMGELGFLNTQCLAFLKTKDSVLDLIRRGSGCYRLLFHLLRDIDNLHPREDGERRVDIWCYLVDHLGQLCQTGAGRSCVRILISHATTDEWQGICVRSRFSAAWFDCVSMCGETRQVFSRLVEVSNDSKRVDAYCLLFDTDFLAQRVGRGLQDSRRLWLRDQWIRVCERRVSLDEEKLMAVENKFLAAAKIIKSANV